MVAVAAEAEALVVRRHHPRRGEHLPVAAAGEQPAAPVHELARGEVAEPRRDVVELDLRDTVRGAARDQDADRLVPRSTRNADRGAPSSATPENAGKNRRMSSRVHPQHVLQVGVVGSDLEHLVRRVVVPVVHAACG